MRDGRKADLEKHVEAINSLLRQEDAVVSDASGEAAIEHEAPWEGFGADDQIDYEDAYSDDDRFTSVTVEAVEISRDGLRKTKNEDEINHNGVESTGLNANVRDNAGETAFEATKAKRARTEEPTKGPKKRKKKFRYESKAERKVTRYKEKSGSRASAKARKKQ